VIDLDSPIAGPSGFYEIEFDLGVTAHSGGVGFSADLAFAGVPEPSSLV
jgi:hypothetical protein